jgi:transposase-like protein
MKCPKCDSSHFDAKIIKKCYGKNDVKWVCQVCKHVTTRESNGKDSMASRDEENIRAT